ncbi:DegT/DnrJ/EryC1/StrS family aminotransferase [Acidovorax sp. HDW3]|uniref:DegT/DnrJ/EryC1/StrS family aminotransferase n=1 Tax=Acidovorax sp. HDW3 TaxID=2714923 RepID=UPI00197ACC11|nr:DegT/DnrJ/EryC1/StrS family aminotransferase [Acidovorax sp. HDW3]
MPTAVHYPIPLNKQPAVTDAAAQLPVRDAIAQHVVSLPMHPYLDTDAQSRVTQVVVQILASTTATTLA